MIAVAAGVKVLVATQPVDFRKGADGLVALVREALGHDPFSETIFIFRSKRADRLKILAWDGSGLPPRCPPERRPRRRARKLSIRRCFHQSYNSPLYPSSTSLPRVFRLGSRS